MTPVSPMSPSRSMSVRETPTTIGPVVLCGELLRDMPEPASYQPFKFKLVKYSSH